MKGLLISVCGLLLLQSCEKYTLTRVYRAQVMYNPGCSRDTVSREPDMPAADTAVFVSAVVVPKEYDWRKDSLYGAVPCGLMLLRNGIPQFSVQTGEIASISPDTHHIMDGHLYTEFVSGAETIICCDGMELFRYPQREMLKGLLIHDGAVYTLGRSLDGPGFCLRRDGEVLLKQDSGELFGDFSNPAYGRSGALYEYGGKVAFCFKTASECYTVVDGTMTLIKTGVSAFRVKDMRPMGQSACYVADYSSSILIVTPSRTYTLPSGTSWQSVSLFMRGRVLWFLADSPSMTLCGSVDKAESLDESIRFQGNDNFVFAGSTRFYSARCDGGTLCISRDDGQILYIRDSTYYFGGNSVFCSGDDIYALVNPRERERPPSVWHGGRETEYVINGYLTGVEVEITLPNL